MTHSSVKRGSVIIVALLMLTILLVSGLGLMASRVGGSRAASQAILSVQADAIARAGLEDALLKLAQDINFPPGYPWPIDQNFFAYTENFANGSYNVVVELNYARKIIEPELFVDPPSDNEYQIFRIVSTGLVGPRDAPLARHTVRADWDRANGRLIRLQDDSAL